MRTQDLQSGSLGVSLVSLLVVIVVLGALTAAAVVGVSTLSDNGSRVLVVNGSGRAKGTGAAGGGGSGPAPGPAAGSSCTASADAARAASAAYYANRGGQSYPVNWSDLTTSNPPVYEVAGDAVINRGIPTELDGLGWKLTISGGGASAPTFTCSSTVRP